MVGQGTGTGPKTKAAWGVGSPDTNGEWLGGRALQGRGPVWHPVVGFPGEGEALRKESKGSRESAVG